MKVMGPYLKLFLFFILTVSLYLLFIITTPIFRDPHGLIVTNELSDFSQSGFVEELLFASAAVCALMGALLMDLSPFLTSGMMANLLATTFLLIWVDSVFALSVRSQSYKFLITLGTASAFIYLFFFTLHYLGFQSQRTDFKPDWKNKVIYQWLWAWMGFYFGLSSLLALGSLDYPGSRWFLAMGALIVCFLNYLLCLFVKKMQGESFQNFSEIGRIVFAVWLMGLILVWLKGKGIL